MKQTLPRPSPCPWGRETEINKIMKWTAFKTAMDAKEKHEAEKVGKKCRGSGSVGRVRPGTVSAPTDCSQRMPLLSFNERITS